MCIHIYVLNFESTVLFHVVPIDTIFKIWLSDNKSAKKYWENIKILENALFTLSKKERYLGIILAERKSGN